MCGRFEAKLEQLHERHGNLMSRGLQEAADLAEKEMEKYQELLEPTNIDSAHLWEPRSRETCKSLAWTNMDYSGRVNSK